jgi:hypothetical protein
MDANTIKKFREALHLGEVNFTYLKKNGEKRVARGTIKSDLLPKVEPGKKFKLTDIESSEGKKVPKRMTLFIPDSKLSEVEHESDAVSRALCEALGFEFNGSYIYFEADEKPARKLAPETVFYFDLDKNEFRSFNESQLLEAELPIM